VWFKSNSDSISEEFIEFPLFLQILAEIPLNLMVCEEIWSRVGENWGQRTNEQILRQKLIVEEPKQGL
jgi:hypothetical protein